jgi:hypothetical protein
MPNDRLLLVRNHDGSFDLITERGVVLVHEESQAFCQDTMRYLDGVNHNPHVYDPQLSAVEYWKTQVCRACGQFPQHPNHNIPENSDAAALAAQLRGDDLA